MTTVIFIAACLYLTRFVGFWPMSVIAALIVLNGCGSDAGVADVDNGQVQSVSLSDYDLDPYKSICVEPGVAEIEADFIACGSLHSEEYCAAEKSSALASLNAAWASIVTELPAIVDECADDFRVSADWCDAYIREWLSDQASMCKFSY